VKFGLALPHYGFSFPDHGKVSFARVAEYARRAERLGFDSVWVSDHFYLSIERYGGGPEKHDALEPVTTLAGLAVLTERVRLGTLVLGVPFRHPAVLAKAAVTIDGLSGGRLDLGLGSGWYEDEFRDFGVPFGTTGERFTMLEEAMQVLGLLFGSDEPVDFEGTNYRLRDATLRPRPVQEPRIPLWLGAKGGPRALKLAARHADGWNLSWKGTPEDYAQKARAADAACEAEGRDPATLKRSIGLYTLVGADQRDLVERWLALQRWTPGGALDGELLEDWARETLTGTPERIVETLADFAAQGVSEVVLSASSLPFAVFDDEMLDVFAEEVIPAARGL
jgi:probable F420-dependent oxidoreductase